ncbi:hypothetical protein Dimus_011329 [Dionaea muscipula]
MMHVAPCKEFYKNLTVSISKKKEVARSYVRGVKIELDVMILAGILGVPENNGILARRVKSTEMKPFQRFLHFIIMKNVALRFGKRDSTSFMDLTYMDHLFTRRLVNLPREKSQKSYDYFEESFLSMCQLKRENKVWWLGIGENRRRDDEDEGVNNENAPTENLEENPEGFEWEAVNDETEIQGEEIEKEAEVEASGSDDKFYDAEVEVEEPSNEIVEVPAVTTFPASPVDSKNVQQKERTTIGVDPSSPTGS